MVRGNPGKAVQSVGNLSAHHQAIPVPLWAGAAVVSASSAVCRFCYIASSVGQMWRSGERMVSGKRKDGEDGDAACDSEKGIKDKGGLMDIAQGPCSAPSPAAWGLDTGVS